MIRTLILVGVGGFFGSAMRYAIHSSVVKTVINNFPWGTFIVNIIGCFLVGIIFAIAEKGNLMSSEWRLLLSVGFCGGFTTFSAFAVQSLDMMQNKSTFQFLFNVGGSIFFGIVAVYLGMMLIRAIV